jgi:hypothetical protein
MNDAPRRILTIHLSTTPYLQELPPWYERGPAITGYFGLVCCLLSVIGLNSPGGSRLWVIPLLLSISVLIGSAIAGVWETRNCEGWNRLPLTPVQGEWLCNAVCVLLLFPLSLICGLTLFLGLTFLPGW